MAWVMKCGAKDHEGTQAHCGAMINWRRRLRGHRKVVRFLDDTPSIIRRARTPMSELNRRTIPAELRYPEPDDWFLWKYRKPAMVIGRDHFIDGGPVGRAYRSK